jgi:hypothetical protein
MFLKTSYSRSSASKQNHCEAAMFMSYFHDEKLSSAEKTPFALFSDFAYQLKVAQYF